MGILGLGDSWRRGRPPDAAAAGRPSSSHRSEKVPLRFGDFLLTSIIGQDGLGRVYRGLLLGEGGEFVRVRIFDVPELPRERLAETVRRAHSSAVRISPHRPRGERLGLARGAAYLAWSEMHGWTLDGLIRDLRRRGRRLPLEHVLLITDGLAKAVQAGGPHGLVWPGFVSISRDGEVRLAGFGLAPGILPSLGAKGVSETLAPYLAPEVREERQPTPEGDVYSVAAITLELLTDDPVPFPGLGRGFGAERLFPNELARILRVALAKKRQRFSSAAELRRELGQFMVSSRLFPSSFHLSRYLRDLDAPRDRAVKPRAAAAEKESSLAADRMPDVPEIPVLEESEIEAVLHRFWTQIER